MRKLTTDEFIEKAQKVHGQKYDYSKVTYLTAKAKVKIYCNQCKQFFLQTPDHHLRGEECPYCKHHIKLTTKTFIERARQKHHNKYNYDKVNYINIDTKVTIYCNKCHSFFQQTPYHHLTDNECPVCSTQKTANLQRKTQETFLKEAQKIHGDLYDYSSVVYKSYHRKVQIYCKNCKKFFNQTPAKHLSQRQGCPYCTFSKGEKCIQQILTSNQIFFIPQKRFKDCKDKQPLPFDFYLPDLNVCIEYQGRQHYYPEYFISRLKSQKEGLIAFKRLQKHDLIKKKYCQSTGIRLIEISYKQDPYTQLKKSLNIK